MRLVCAKCGTFLKILKNGVCIEEGMGDEQHRPYKLWLSDIYKCEKCHVEIARLTNEPMSEHFMTEFKAIQAQYPDRVIVNDCPGSYRGTEDADSVVKSHRPLAGRFPKIV